MTNNLLQIKDFKKMIENINEDNAEILDNDYNNRRNFLSQLYEYIEKIDLSQINKHQFTENISNILIQQNNYINYVNQQYQSIEEKIDDILEQKNIDFDDLDYENIKKYNFDNNQQKTLTIFNIFQDYFTNMEELINTIKNILKILLFKLREYKKIEYLNDDDIKFKLKNMDFENILQFIEHKLYNDSINKEQKKEKKIEYVEIIDKNLLNNFDELMHNINVSIIDIYKTNLTYDKLIKLKDYTFQLLDFINEHKISFTNIDNNYIVKLYSKINNKINEKEKDEKEKDNKLKDNKLKDLSSNIYRTFTDRIFNVLSTNVNTIDFLKYTENIMKKNIDLHNIINKFDEFDIKIMNNNWNFRIYDKKNKTDTLLNCNEGLLNKIIKPSNDKNRNNYNFDLDNYNFGMEKNIDTNGYKQINIQIIGEIKNINKLFKNIYFNYVIPNDDNKIINISFSKNNGQYFVEFTCLPDSIESISGLLCSVKNVKYNVISGENKINCLPNKQNNRRKNESQSVIKKNIKYDKKPNEPPIASTIDPNSKPFIPPINIPLIEQPKQLPPINKPQKQSLILDMINDYIPPVESKKDKDNDISPFEYNDEEDNEQDDEQQNNEENDDQLDEDDDEQIDEEDGEQIDNVLNEPINDIKLESKSNKVTNKSNIKEPINTIKITVVKQNYANQIFNEFILYLKEGKLNSVKTIKIIDNIIEIEITDDINDELEKILCKYNTSYTITNNDTNYNLQCKEKINESPDNLIEEQIDLPNEEINKEQELIKLDEDKLEIKESDIIDLPNGEQSDDIQINEPNNLKINEPNNLQINEPNNKPSDNILYIDSSTINFRGYNTLTEYELQHKVFEKLLEVLNFKKIPNGWIHNYNMSSKYMDINTITRMFIYFKYRLVNGYYWLKY